MEAVVERTGAEGKAGTVAGANDAGGADPFGFELFRNAIFAIADEMALAVCRTAYCGVLRDNMDFSTALGEIDQALLRPSHVPEQHDRIQ